eukprot:CAMPEP_0206441802 /NCGR_PEP_ID=MMETSP0324_2-20121206/13475_1 /ASSEMBLY_ACC=CAM_ASM_000836 /TAXON_ID=2866 /ORGANISM="Crypthecodinium cohnii, Strain Seligo" /LENGTH=673 /DNA_ID=CAMNT_0053909587 /DNA_START=38 /DNA_END=2056 /DNA_ORIENTATION=+
MADKWSTETFSGCPVPSSISTGTGAETRHLHLLTTGLRAKRIGFVDVQVYAFSAYIDPSEIAEFEQLEQDIGVLRDNSAEKVVMLTFLRGISGKQFSDGLAEGLKVAEKAGKPVPPEAMEVISKAVPSSVDKGMCILLRMLPTSDALEIQVFPPAALDPNSAVHIFDRAAEGSPLITVTKDPGLCAALHEVYFGPGAVLKGLTASLKAQLPLLTSLASAAQQANSSSNNNNNKNNNNGDNSNNNNNTNHNNSNNMGSCSSSDSGCDDEQQSVARLPDAAVAGPGLDPREVSPTSGHVSCSFRSWKERARRPHGPDSYKFGDVTRSLLHKASPSRLSQLRPEAPTFTAEAGSELWLTPTQSSTPSSSSSFPFFPGNGSEKREGILYKEQVTMGRPRWSSRHFVLEHCTLSYRHKVGHFLKESCSVLGSRLIAEAPSTTHPIMFVVRLEWGPTEAPVQIWRLGTPDRTVAQDWITWLGSAIQIAYQQHADASPGPSSQQSPQQQEQEQHEQHQQQQQQQQHNTQGRPQSRGAPTNSQTTTPASFRSQQQQTQQHNNNSNTNNNNNTNTNAQSQDQSQKPQGQDQDPNHEQSAPQARSTPPLARRCSSPGGKCCLRCKSPAAADERPNTANQVTVARSTGLQALIVPFAPLLVLLLAIFASAFVPEPWSGVPAISW